jgi:hypothetical protein
MDRRFGDSYKVDLACIGIGNPDRWICVALAGVLVCPLVRTLLSETLFPATENRKSHFVLKSVREQSGNSQNTPRS